MVWPWISVSVCQDILRLLIRWTLPPTFSRDIFDFFCPKKDCNLNRICREISRGGIIQIWFWGGPLLPEWSFGLLQICTHYPPLFPILSKFKCEFVKAMAPFTVVQHLFVIQNHFGFSCLFRVGTLGDHYWILASSFYCSRNSSSSLFPALKRKKKRETNFNKDLRQDRS